MALLEIDWRPAPRQLRVFSLAWLLALGALAAIIRWRWGVPGLWAPLAAGLGLAGGVLGLLWPAGMQPFYVALMALSYPVGLVVSHLVLLLIYYLFLTPTGLLRRLAGKDPLALRGRGEESSYWHRRGPRQVDPRRYFRQF